MVRTGEPTAKQSRRCDAVWDPFTEGNYVVADAPVAGHGLRQNSHRSPEPGGGGSCRDWETHEGGVSGQHDTGVPERP